MAIEISIALRQGVIQRAENRCEYCLMPQTFALHPHEPDHIIPLQHGGETSEDNLTLACMRCNRHKGPNVGSFDPETKKLVAFYQPRTQNWQEHFRLVDGEIQPLTPEGRVTVKILRLNDEVRIQERQRLIQLGKYSAPEDV